MALTKRGKVVVGGALIGAGIALPASAVGVNQLTNHFEQQQAEELLDHQQVEAYSQPNIAEKYSQRMPVGNRIGRVALYRVIEGDTPITIAQNLGSEDVSDTVAEITGQLGSTIYPGESVALPMEDLNPEAIVEQEPSSDIHPSWNENNDPDAVGVDDEPFVTYVVPER